MPIELIVIIGIVVILAGAYLFFGLAKRAFRLAIRLVLFGALILIIVVGGLLYAWYGTGDTKPSSQQNRPANTKRGNSR